MWTRSRYVLISCNMFYMLVKGFKWSGGVEEEDDSDEEEEEEEQGVECFW